MTGVRTSSFLSSQGLAQGIHFNNLSCWAGKSRPGLDLLVHKLGSVQEGARSRNDKYVCIKYTWNIIMNRSYSNWILKANLKLEKGSQQCLPSRDCTTNEPNQGSWIPEPNRIQIHWPRCWTMDPSASFINVFHSFSTFLRYHHAFPTHPRVPFPRNAITIPTLFVAYSLAFFPYHKTW